MRVLLAALLACAACGAKKGAPDARIDTSAREGESVNYVTVAAVGRVTIRSVPPDVLERRSDARITKGRMLRTGTNEAIVGIALADSFRLGQRFEWVKDRPCDVVGVFAAPGLEAEVWIDADLGRFLFDQ